MRNFSYEKRDKAIMIWTGIVRIAKAKYSNNNYVEGKARTYKSYIDEDLKAEYDKNMKKYNKWYQEFLRNDATEETTKLTNYVFKSSNLGWINCDRFYNIPEYKKTNLIVKSETPVTLIFDKINAVMRSSSKNINKGFFRIPKGEKVTLFSVQKRNGQLFMAIHQTRVSSEPVLLEYEAVTFEEMQEKLDFL